MAIAYYKGIKVPTSPSDTINSGTTTVGGILIENDKMLADRVTRLEGFRWNESELSDGINELYHLTSLYQEQPVAAPVLTESDDWIVGCEARVGITFAENASLQYPGSWKWIGDDCQEGNFIFEQGKSYWLFIEKRPDFTWVTVTRCP